MPYQYGNTSRARIATLHPTLAYVMYETLKRSPYDIVVISGHRGEELQNALFDKGASEKRYPDSRHNGTKDPLLQEDPPQLSDAVDFAPWVNGRIPWEDTHIFAVIFGVMTAVAHENNVKLRWGGDWNGDGSTSDQSLMDWGHVEIVW